jgi:hypothetical protein
MNIDFFIYNMLYYAVIKYKFQIVSKNLDSAVSIWMNCSKSSFHNPVSDHNLVESICPGIMDIVV